MTATLTRSPELIEAMKPIEIPEMPGVSAYFGFTATQQACDATGHAAPAQLLGALLRGESRAIEESAARGLLNSDGSRWQGGIDAVPLPILALGRLLADALHRRLFGEPLKLEGGE